MEEIAADFGILVIATGKRRYIDLAINLSLSLRLSNPALSIALVTDSTDTNLHKYFDHIIFPDLRYDSGFSQKVNAYAYSPFRRTMLIDADCLVIRDISFLIEKFSGRPVSVIGRKIFAGPLLDTTVEKIKEKISLSYLLSFNGGIYYFEKCDTAAQVYRDARKIFDERYDELGLWKFNGRPGDEPAMSVAMGMHGMEPVDDGLRGMYTPVGQEGVFEMDSLTGKCEFIKAGTLVNPAVMHFGGGYPEAFHYRREIRKIRMAVSTPLPKRLISILVNLVYNPVYISYVFFYRLAKAMTGRSRMKLFPLMPMFRFE